MSRRRRHPKEVVAIEARARGDSLDVHVVEDVRVRTWISPGFEAEHLSYRRGLPMPIERRAYGPFEAGMEVRGMVAGERDPGGERRPATKRAARRLKMPRRSR